LGPLGVMRVEHQREGMRAHPERVRPAIAMPSVVEPRLERGMLPRVDRRAQSVVDALTTRDSHETESAGQMVGDESDASAAPHKIRAEACEEVLDSRDLEHLVDLITV
jgi:hypothetical protein